MTIRKTIIAIAAPFALAAVIGSTVVFAQSADDTPTPSTDAPPATAPDEATPGMGRHHGGSKEDCPHMGGSHGTEDSDAGTDTATLY